MHILFVVRDTIRSLDRIVLTSGLVHWNRVAISEQMGLVLGERSSHEHAHVLAHDCVLWDTCTFKSLEGALQEKTLLRIHRDGLLLSQAKKRGVESGQIDIQEVAAHSVEGSSFAGIWMVESGRVETSLWYFCESSSCSRQKFPEFAGGCNIARHSTGHAHNGNGHRLCWRVVMIGTAIGMAVGVSVRAMAIGVSVIAIEEAVPALRERSRWSSSSPGGRGVGGCGNGRHGRP